MESRHIIWQLKARMLGKELTKEDLCERCELNKRTFYLISTGRQGFSIELLKKISSALECSMEDLTAPIPQEYL